MAEPDFFKRIEGARRDLGISRHQPWFRGQKSSDYALIPSLVRHERLIRSESDLMALFIQRGRSLLEDIGDKWSLLAVMQHYGVPTKLLDWTSDINTALYFALIYNVSFSERMYNPHVWVLNPFRLNQMVTGKNVIFDEMDPVPAPYSPANKDGCNWPYALPIALGIAWRDKRLTAQRGFFTYHGTSATPLDESTRIIDDGKLFSCAKKVVIQSHEIKSLRKFLKQSRISHFEMFSDLDNLAKDLKEQMGFLPRLF
jgi:hypothetical protein